MTDVELAMTRTWAEVDLDALEHNSRALKGALAPGCRTLAVCKANAYGHGLLEVARKLQALGADMLAVACVPEAAELRKGGVSMPILCFGQSAPALAPLVWEHDIIQAVGDAENARALSETAAAAGRRIRIHIKLDTGMSRIGFLWSDGKEEETAEELAAVCRLPGLEAEGLFTHFADADGSRDYTLAQLRRVRAARQALADRGFPVKICHCAASVGTLLYPEAHLDMARFGLALYGYASSDARDANERSDLKAVMTVKSRISSVRALPRGTCVSYGRTATLERDSVLAVLPMGYADVLPRSLSNKGRVRIHDALCPIVGRVCMDMCMADVTDLEGVRAGDVATVYDGALMLDAMENSGTIIHELLTRVMPRVPRLYIEGGKIRE